MSFPILENDQQAESEIQGSTSHQDETTRYLDIQGSNGMVRVDVERARAAMKYAIGQWDKLSKEDFSQTVEDSRYLNVEGSLGTIRVDVDKARKAMDYAIKQHLEARKKNRIGDVESN